MPLKPMKYGQGFSWAVFQRPKHISILEQFQAINVISFGVLASKFNAESKNIHLFAGNVINFFTLRLKNFQWGTL